MYKFNSSVTAKPGTDPQWGKYAKKDPHGNSSGPKIVL
jgi:hypothetical protein